LARIKHLVTRWSQNNMHLLSFVMHRGLAHLPMQFAALSSLQADDQDDPQLDLPI
jgi:hypothetical protein